MTHEMYATLLIGAWVIGWAHIIMAMGGIQLNITLT